MEQATARQATQWSPQGSEISPDQCAQGVGAPSVDIFDSPDELAVYADIAGIPAEDIRLEGNERQLRIVAKRGHIEAEEDVTPIQQERLRRAERTIDLPVDVEIEDAEARCENGVCIITLPKTKQQIIGIQ